MYLVREGKSNCSIVLRKNAGDVEKFAAGEISKYVRLMSGAGMRICQGRESITGHAIELSVGRLKNAGQDGFSIEAAGDAVKIRGMNERGLLYGAYAFLELHGCRWVAPGEDFVPRTRNLLCKPMTITESPNFEYRSRAPCPRGNRRELLRRFVEEIDWAGKSRINSLALYLTWDDIDVPGHGRIKVSPDDYERRLRPEILKRGLRINTCGHSFFLWLPPSEYFGKHPEYFSLVEGKRKPMQICVSNKDAVAEVAKRMIRFLRNHPEVGFLDLSPMDGQAWCECPKCRKIDSIDKRIGGGGWFGKKGLTTRSYMSFVNAVAGRVGREFPRVMFLATAYVQYIDAPKRIRIRKNVGVDLYWYWRCYGHEIDARGCPRNEFYMRKTREWKKLVEDRVCVSEYHYGMMAWNELPYPILRKMSHDWPVMKRAGIMGGQSKPGENPYYVVNTWYHSKLLWDIGSSTRLNALLRDYCRAAYGQAWRLVYDYIMVLEDALDDIDAYFEPYMDTCLTQLLPVSRSARLERLAGKIKKTTCEKTVAARIDRWLVFHRHTMLCLKTRRHMESAKRFEEDGMRKEAQREYRLAVDAAGRSLKNRHTRGIVRNLERAEEVLGRNVRRIEQDIAEDVTEKVRKVQV